VPAPTTMLRHGGAPSASPWSSAQFSATPVPRPASFSTR
jgi:hypothetical protein